MNKEELMMNFRKFNLGAISGGMLGWILFALVVDIRMASSIVLLAYIITITTEIESKIRKISKGVE